MQMLLPLFTQDVTLINHRLGVFEKEGIVYYLLGGLPIYSHGKDDLQSFRFFISNLIHQGLCRKSEIRDAFHITIDYVNRSYRLYNKEGEAGFFKPENRHGYCYKLIGEKLETAQRCLDEGKSNSATAREVNVVESAIRYAIKQGRLKKKLQ